MTTDLDNSFDAPPPAREKSPTREDILGALKWSAQREVATKLGPRLVSSADANQLVFDLWRREQSALRSDGYSLGEYRGKWQISRWEKVPEKIVVQREEAKALSRATDATINVPAPEGYDYLPFQRAGIAYAFERPATLIGDEMGLGKTIQAIGILNACPELRRVLVICPASLKLNWRNELNRWLVRPRPILVADSKTFVPLADGIVVINYDVLHKHEAAIKGTEWDLLIADESHYCKNPKARRTQMVFGKELTAKQRANGDTPVPGITAKKRLLLTGTPIANKPVELWPLIHYLDPGTWGNFFKYALRYCAAYQGSHGWDFTGASNLSEMQDRLRSTILLRRLKRDVLLELPQKRRQIIEFPADTPTLRAVVRAELGVYDEVEELEARVELAEASEDKAAYDSSVAALAKGQRACFEGMSQLRRETAEAKIPLMVEHLRDACESSGKVIFFAHHKSVIAAMAAEFGAEAVQLVGDTSMNDRQAAVDRFQSDPTCKIFLGSITAAGVGITLTASSHVVFGELSWVPGDVSQAEDRAHRIGQRESVLVQHLVLEGSLDATMAKRIIAKQSVIDRALDVVTAKPATSEGQRPARPAKEGLDAIAAKMTDDQCAAAQEAIRILRAHCNGATSWDGAGFSKIDVHIGHSLASQPVLTRKQAALARKLGIKYQRQLPASLVGRMI